MSAKAGVRRDPDGIWFDGQVGGNGVGGGSTPSSSEACIIDMQWNATTKAIQVKYSGSNEWVDKIPFAQFDD